MYRYKESVYSMYVWIHFNDSTHDRKGKEYMYGNQMVSAIILIPQFTNYKTLCFYSLRSWIIMASSLLPFFKYAQRIEWSRSLLWNKKLPLSASFSSSSEYWRINYFYANDWHLTRMAPWKIDRFYQQSSWWLHVLH